MLSTFIDSVSVKQIQTTPLLRSLRLSTALSLYLSKTLKLDLCNNFDEEKC